ncbi:vascular cell adhesion protein 1 [Spea bombifrons]|uniref:vascular cell adhesion protein 1 n=1 Tax=Spea bombifrons TaxID=233779 RepID=UPI00234AF36F|nr:vascular cell adhesion protein 1 [Spea bombifrons]
MKPRIHCTHWTSYLERLLQKRHLIMSGTKGILPSALGFIQITCLFMTTSASSIMFSPSESVIPVQIGEPLVIIGTALDCDEPSFTWSSLMDKTLSGTVSTKGHISNLTMMMVTKESEGQYVCKVFCKNGKSEKSVKIIPYSFPSDPILRVSSLVVGVRSTINCTVPLVYPVEMMSVKILVDKNEVAESIPEWNMDDTNQMENVSLSYGWIPTEEHEGMEVQCVAQLEFTTNEIKPMTRDAKITLNLNYPPGNPHITVYPSTKVNLMDTIYLNCSSESRTPARKWWVKQTEYHDYEVYPSEDGFLTILQAKPENSGKYICYVENAVGKKEDSVEITVQDTPNQPTINILPKTTVLMGEAVTIECYGHGQSGTNVSLWMMTETEHKLLLDGDGVYEIHEAQPQHTAVYVCRAENLLKKAEATVSLTVEYLPKNTVISYFPSDAKEGDTVTLSCKSDGVPTPSFSIYQHTKSGGTVLLVNGPDFTVRNVTSMNNGVYECEAYNTVGSEKKTAELLVQVPPKNTHLIIMPSTSVMEGQSVHVSCISEAYPTPELTLIKYTDSGLLDWETSDGEHTIVHASVEHSGIYRCESRNAVGEEVVETVLTVQVPPENTTVVVTPSENVTEGDTVTIICDSHSIPSPTIILQKVCPGNSTIMQAENGTFTLRNVTVNDTGTYTVSIINEAGNRTKVIEINVQERQQGSKYSLIAPAIVLSMAAVSAGFIGFLIYKMKQARLKGSYSLVNALKNRV